MLGIMRRFPSILELKASNDFQGMKRGVQKMKKSVLILLVLVVATLGTPLAAAKETNPPDPVCNICTKLDTLVASLSSGTTNILDAIDALGTDILDAIDALDGKIDTAQTDITAIKTDVATIKTDVEAIDCGGSGSDYSSVMYTSPAVTDLIVLDVTAPGVAGDQLTVTVKDWVWAHNTDPEGYTYTLENSCEGGEVTLSPFNQEITCVFDGDERTIIQVIIPKEYQDKVTFQLVYKENGLEEARIHGAGEFKVDYI
jgi:hypothetical protein